MREDSFYFLFTLIGIHGVSTSYTTEKIEFRLWTEGKNNPLWLPVVSVKILHVVIKTSFPVYFLHCYPFVHEMSTMHPRNQTETTYSVMYSFCTYTTRESRRNIYLWFHVHHNSSSCGRSLSRLPTVEEAGQHFFLIILVLVRSHLNDICRK